MTANIVGWAHMPFGKFDNETVESMVVRVANEASVASFDLAGFSRWPTGSDEGPDTLRFTSAESVE